MVSDVSTLLLIAPIIWTTGGWQTPLMPAMIFPVAFYAQFMAGWHAYGRVLAAVTLFSAAFWLSDFVGAAEGMPDAPARTLFTALLTAFALITLILQHSRRATDVAIETIRDSATFDPLTGAFNVHAFRADLESMVETVAYEPAATSRGVPGGVRGHRALPALIVADVDDFRVVNKRSGHLVGDAVLKSVTERLRKTIGDNGSVYRIDSDEFAVLLKVDAVEDAAVVARRLQQALERRTPLNTASPESVSVSFGHSVWRTGLTPVDLVDEAKAGLSREQAVRGAGEGRRGGATLL